METLSQTAMALDQSQWKIEKQAFIS